MSPARSEAGFTLIELLLAVAILGVVVVPLAGGIIVGLRTMDSSSNRYAGSNDAQTLTRYLSPDIQSSNSAETNGFDPCTGTTNPKLQLTLISNDTDARTIMYWVRGLPNGRYELVRSVWANADGTCTSPQQPIRSTVVAGNIASPGQVSPTCNAGTCSMSVTVAPERNESTGYQFTVSGRQRPTP